MRVCYIFQIFLYKLKFLHGGLTDLRFLKVFKIEVLLGKKYDTNQIEPEHQHQNPALM